MSRNLWRVCTGRRSGRRLYREISGSGAGGHKQPPLTPAAMETAVEVQGRCFRSDDKPLEYLLGDTGGSCLRGEGLGHLLFSVSFFCAIGIFCAVRHFP